jgi:hypothetical protein
MFGFTPNNPLSNVWALADLLPNNPDPVALRETWNRARRNLVRAHERVRRFYDRGRRPNNFAIEQLVMVRKYPQSRAADHFSAKFGPRCRGPFKIIQFLTPVTVRLASTVDDSLSVSCSSLPAEAGFISTCILSPLFILSLSASWCYVRALWVLYILLCVFWFLFSACMFQRMGPRFPLPNPVGCLFDEPHGTHDLDLAENTFFQLLGLKILFRFFGFENR